MKYLFGAEGTAELARLNAGTALFAFDFDGTLAPIEPRPEEARVPADVTQRLQALTQLAPVAVISGRRRADLVERLPATVRYLVGNHGNEGSPLAIDTAAMLSACEGWRAQLSACLAADPRGASVLFEDKSLSLSLHYRQARDREGVAAWLQECVDRLAPKPHVIAGKLSLNLMPPGAVTKFDALAAIAAAERADAVLFVGDDDNDEIVFARAPRHWLTVRVELQRGSRARYFLHQQSGVATLLDHLVRSRTALANQQGGEA